MDNTDYVQVGEVYYGNIEQIKNHINVMKDNPTGYLGTAAVNELLKRLEQTIIQGYNLHKLNTENSVDDYKMD